MFPPVTGGLYCGGSWMMGTTGLRPNGLALNVRTRTEYDIYHHVHRASPGHHVTRVFPRPQKQGHWAYDRCSRRSTAASVAASLSTSPARATRLVSAVSSPRLYCGCKIPCGII